MITKPEVRETLRRVLAFSFLLVLTLPSPTPAGTPRPSPAPEDPAADPTAGVSRYDARIQDLRFYRNDDYLYADLRLTGAFIGEVRERIDSGLEVKFRYTVELLKKRGWWFDRRLVHRTVFTRVVRDTMAGRYILSREVDGEEVARTSTEEAAAVREWMSHLEKIPLLHVSDIPQEEAGGQTRLTVRARAKVRDDFILLFIPWDFETGWERVVHPLAEVAEVPSGEQEGGDAPGDGSAPAPGRGP